MADFSLISSINTYIGASTDTKPTSCKNGSRAYEYDTKKWFITHDGGSTWSETQDLDAIVLGAGSALIGKVGIDQTTPGTTNRVDVGAALPAGTNAIGKTGHDVTSIGDGRKTVTTAGTRVTLAASTPAKAVIITALSSNTDLVVVGGTTVVAALATRQGTPLDAGESIVIACDNLTDINIDSLVSGEGVSFTYVN